MWKGLLPDAQVRGKKKKLKQNTVKKTLRFGVHVVSRFKSAVWLSKLSNCENDGKKQVEKNE